MKLAEANRLHLQYQVFLLALEGEKELFQDFELITGCSLKPCLLRG